MSSLAMLRSVVRSRTALHLEILALRHQLQVLQRSQPQRLRLARADRCLWAWLSRTWGDWRTALVIVKPETVVAWHRKGFRLFWTWKSRGRTGRPALHPDVRTLIRQIARENPMGRATDTRRTPEARRQRLSGYGGEVHGATGQTALAVVAHLPLPITSSRSPQPISSSSRRLRTVYCSCSSSSRTSAAESFISP